MGRFTFAAVGVICALSIGCSDGPPADSTATADTTAVSGDTTEASPVETAEASPVDSTGTESSRQTVSVEIRSWAELQEWVATQKNKVVVVDVWSTSCEKCVKEFPHFVDLHNRLGDQVACASFSIDYYGVDTPDDLKPQVLEFLTAKNATGTNFLSSTPDEQVMEALEVASIPAALIYDQSGALKKTFDNDDDEYGPEGFTYENHVAPLVTELLKSVD
jgi:thiol-disulfide isomerase/thioredoxin